MKQLVLASSNPGKLREFGELLASLGIEVVPQGALGVPDAEEPHATFVENALAKARNAARHAKLPALADDSGICVAALDGEPGVHSARFLSPDATYAARFAAIQSRLEARPSAPRSARFVCALAVVERGRIVFETRGVIEGVIAREARGHAGFGYDPIFEYPPFGKTLAEVDEPDKLAVAHRGHAFRALAQWLAERRV